MWLELEGWMERSERMEEQLKGYNRLAKDMGQRRTQKNRVKVPPRFLISDNTWMLALFSFFSFVLFFFFFNWRILEEQQVGGKERAHIHSLNKTS